MYNRLNIEQAPLQTYVSALLFAPVNSIVRGLFSVEEPSWVLTKPAVEQSWNLCFQTLEGHSSSVKSVAFSPDGSRIASGSSDRTIKIWDAKSGKEIRTLEGHSDSVAFSPDGSRIASGSADRTIKIWDAKLGKKIHTLEGHSGSVKSVAFSPDGSRIASGSADRVLMSQSPGKGYRFRTKRCQKCRTPPILSPLKKTALGSRVLNQLHRHFWLDGQNRI